MDEWINEWVNEWLNEWVSEWMNEWIGEWISESMNERMSEWAIKWVIECMCEYGWVWDSSSIWRTGSLMQTTVLYTILKIKFLPGFGIYLLQTR